MLKRAGLWPTHRSRSWSSCRDTRAVQREDITHAVRKLRAEFNQSLAGIHLPSSGNKRVSLHRLLVWAALGRQASVRDFLRGLGRTDVDRR